RGPLREPTLDEPPGLVLGVRSPGHERDGLRVRREPVHRLEVGPPVLAEDQSRRDQLHPGGFAGPAALRRPGAPAVPGARRATSGTTSRAGAARSGAWSRRASRWAARAG